MSGGTPPWPDETTPAPPCPFGCGHTVHWNPCETAETLTVEEDRARAERAGLRMLVDADWLRRKAETDPDDAECGAGFELCAPAPETPTPAALAPEGTEDGRSNRSGIDPEKAALRERVRGLEEALSKYDAAISWVEPPFVDIDTDDDEVLKRLNFMLDDIKRARALLPLPEGGRGKAAQSQPSRDEGPTASLPPTQHSDGGEA